jgi:hypothetical protein
MRGREEIEMTQTLYVQLGLTQSLALAKQAFYHLSHISSSLFFFLNM